MADARYRALCGTVFFLTLVAWVFLHTIFGEWLLALLHYPFAGVAWVWSLLPWWGWLAGFIVLCVCMGDEGGRLFTSVFLLGMLGVSFYGAYRMIDIALPMIITSWYRTH